MMAELAQCAPFDFRQIRLRASGYRGKWRRAVASRHADPMISKFFSAQNEEGVWLLRLHSTDRTNRLTRACVMALTEAVHELSQQAKPLVITGSAKFFSAGAELEEIAELNGPAAYEFSKMGQALMRSVEQFPAAVFAAISGYCMGGGVDLALACHRRIAAPNAVFGHRGAALGLITGWGGTQRLPRLIGKGRALEMLVTAEKLDAWKALHIGLIEAMTDDPVAEALRRIRL
jgi:enoyl-CoA hydratase